MPGKEAWYLGGGRCGLRALKGFLAFAAGRQGGSQTQQGSGAGEGEWAGKCKFSFFLMQRSVGRPAVLGSNHAFHSSVRLLGHS